MTETTISSLTSEITETSSLLEVIRGELRCSLAEERKRNRALLLKDKRPALGETIDERCFRSCKDIAEKAKELKKDALSMKDYLSLQNSLIKDEATINNFLKEEDALESLTRDLSCGNPAIQLIAAGCCCNIALANHQVCTLLAKSAGPYLVAELHTLNYHLLEVCARTIGNLCVGSKIAFEVLYAQGFLRRLICLIDDCDDFVLSSIVYAIKRCLYTGHDIITDSEVTDTTLALIRRNNFSHDTETLWILALLSSREASHEQLIVTIETIFQLVWIDINNPDESNVELVTPGIRLMGNTVCEKTGNAADIFLDSSKSNDAIIFFEKLLSYPSVNVRKETLWFLGNLYNHAQTRIQARVRTDLNYLLDSLKQFTSCAFDPSNGYFKVENVQKK